MTHLPQIEFRIGKKKRWYAWIFNRANQFRERQRRTNSDSWGQCRIEHKEKKGEFFNSEKDGKEIEIQIIKLNQANRETLKTKEKAERKAIRFKICFSCPKHESRK